MGTSERDWRLTLAVPLVGTLGVPSLIAGLLQVASTRDFLARASGRVEGQVSRTYTKHSREDSTTYITVSYTVDGRTHDVEVGGPFLGYEYGDPVPVRYVPEQPAVARITAPASSGARSCSCSSSAPPCSSLPWPSPGPGGGSSRRPTRPPERAAPGL